MGALLNALIRIAGSKTVNIATLLAIFGDDVIDWVSDLFSSSSDALNALIQLTNKSIITKAFGVLLSGDTRNINKAGFAFLHAGSVLITSASTIKDRLYGIIYIEVARLLLISKGTGVKPSQLTALSKEITKLSVIDVTGDGAVDDEDVEAAEEQISKASEMMLAENDQYRLSVALVANLVYGFAYMSDVPEFNIVDDASALIESYSNGKGFNKLYTFCSLALTAPTELVPELTNGGRYGSMFISWKVGRTRAALYNTTQSASSEVNSRLHLIGVGNPSLLPSTKLLDAMDLYISMELIKM